MTKKQDLGDSLQKLAAAIVTQARGEAVTMEERTEVLRVVGAFYLGVSKIKLKLGDDDDSETPTFKGFKNLINGAAREMQSDG